MSQRHIFLLCASLSSAGILRAQVDVLSVREAEGIVERLPAFAAAAEKGECPQSTVTYPGQDELSFQVRRECGPNAGTLLDNYSVNRRTGAVVLWGDNPKPVASVESRDFADRLVKSARLRALSVPEAACLAREAAQSLTGWSGAGADISVKPFPLKQPGSAYFTAERRDSLRPVQSGRMLRVDLGAARVRDDETGQEVFSEGLGSLASLIVGIRAPLLLSDEDVLSITLRVPGIAARLGDGCKLTTGGAFLSNEALVGVLCGGRNVEGTAMAVDLQTGQIKQVDTGEILKSSDATRLARQLLDKLAQQQSELRRRLAALCQ